MGTPEELSLGLREPSQFLKGKRTKRVRLQSPVPFSVTANSSTGEEDRAACYKNNCNNHDDENKNHINSPSHTASLVQFQNSAEEEEDMANCLILLAQGQSRDPWDNAKYSGRKFMEAATLGSGKAGYYVYECKTCNKTFPSFQALGGHRASHKKPKAMAMENGNKQQQQTLLSPREQEYQFKYSGQLSLCLNSTGNLYCRNSKSKIHECSICGVEFTSGQALGGHMRRHRAQVGANTTLSLMPRAMKAEEETVRKRKNVVSLDLDLNLPAPEEDQRESKFALESKQQQQQQQQAGLVFSASALVNCHN